MTVIVHQAKLSRIPYLNSIVLAGKFFVHTCQKEVEIQMQNTMSLTSGSIGKVLIRFSVPFLLANLLQALYGAVDLLVVGQFCGAASVSAVSTGTQVTQIITSLISGMTLAGTILVGKYAGMKNTEKIEKTISTTITFFAVFSVFLTILLIINIPGILRLLKTPEQAYSEAYSYIFICCLGIFFICEYNALSAVLRGYGDSISPLLFVAIACVCNIAGDFLTVGILHMGAAGTAIATISSQAISMLCAIIYLNRKKFIVRFSLKNLTLDRRILKELIVIGIPISFQECMVRFSFLYLTSITNGLGVFSSCAVGIASKYDVFAMLPATSIANALAALTAQNLGAGEQKRAARFLKYGILIALGCSLIFFIWAQAAPQTMIGLFSKDPDVIAAGIPFFRACSFDYLAVSVLFCINGYLNGSEKMLVTMVNCCFGALCIRVPLLYLLSHADVGSLIYYGCVSPLSTLVMLAAAVVYLAVKVPTGGCEARRTCTQ